MNSTQVLKVINNFKKVLPADTKKNSLNMGDGTVHVCKSVHCHAGWYAVAVMNPFRLLLPVTFMTGGDLMAKDLGFEEGDQLKNWAVDNPSIWGNSFGDTMFFNRMAFYHEDKRPDGAQSIGDIIDHWTDIYFRLRAKEDKATFTNITSELSKLPITQETSDVKRTKTHYEDIGI